MVLTVVVPIVTAVGMHFAPLWLGPAIFTAGGIAGIFLFVNAIV